MKTIHHDPTARIASIWQQDERTLTIEWTDARTDSFDVVALRRQCPCAVCKDEYSGRRLIPDHQIPETIRPVEIKSVGRYAISIRFSDGHATGIYPFDLLRNFPKRLDS